MEENIFEEFQPVETKKASQAIYEQIKEMILDGRLKPDDRLPSERKMMDMFQRSRPTIREALRMLERDGYLKTIPGSHGAVILQPDNANVRQSMAAALMVGNISLSELHEYRSISESAAVALAAVRRNDEDLTALKNQLAAMADKVTSHDEFIAMDADFHELLSRAAKNGVSEIMNRTLSELNRTFVHRKMDNMTAAGRTRMCKRIQKMHEAIYEAIAAGNAEAAKAAMQAHLQAFEEDLK